MTIPSGCLYPAPCSCCGWNGGDFKYFESDAKMARPDKLKALEKWRWEHKLLTDYLVEASTRPIPDPVLNHAQIVKALIRSAEKELGL